MLNKLVFALVGSLLATLVMADGTSVKIDNGQLLLEQPITFSTGGSELQAESSAALRAVSDFLQDKTYITTLRIEGHVAFNNNEEDNLHLSQARALAVAKRLTEQGIDCHRLIAVGFGSSKPIMDNMTPEGRKANTRVVFKPAALRERPIGGMPIDGGGVVAGDVCPP